MPRMLRLESPGSLAHVMARGIDGQVIFRSDQDRMNFLARLETLLEKTAFRCQAWCLMDNHYHVLIRTGEIPMARLLRPLNGGYARWFNKKYGRRGYLFQDRYRSVLCQDRDYARHLIRYIHLNPLRAGMVGTFADLSKWKWSGHRFLLGRKDALGSSFLERKGVLRRFGNSETAAVESYLAFLKEGVGLGDRGTAGALGIVEAFELEGSRKGWPAVIGDPDYVRGAMAGNEVGSRRRHRQADYPETLKAVESAICAEFAITPGELRTRDRKGVRSAARAKFAAVAHCQELLPLAAIARFLNVTIPPVSRMVDRWESRIKQKQKG